MGPLRVFPGRLSVSRTFGDVEAKLTKYGGNPKVVVAIPEIQVFEIDSSCDFLILACDGVFDKLTNKETVECVWETVEKRKKDNIHEQIAEGVELILKKSCARRTLDNITAVIIGLDKFKTLWEAPKPVTHV